MLRLREDKAPPSISVLEQILGRKIYWPFGVTLQSLFSGRTATVTFTLMALLLLLLISVIATFSDGWR